MANCKWRLTVILFICLSFKSYSQSSGITVYLDVTDKGKVQASFSFPELDDDRLFKFTMLSMARSSEMTPVSHKIPHFFGRLAHNQPQLENAFTIGVSSDVREPVNLILDPTSKNIIQNKITYSIDVVFFRNIDRLTSDEAIASRFIPVSRVILKNVNDFNEVLVDFGDNDRNIQNLPDDLIIIPEKTGKFSISLSPKIDSNLSKSFEIVFSNLAQILVLLGIFSGIAIITKKTKVEIIVRISIALVSLSSFIYIAYMCLIKESIFLVFSNNTYLFIVFFTTVITSVFYEKLDVTVKNIRQMLQA